MRGRRPGPDGIIPVGTLTALVRSYNPNSDTGLIEAAYAYGARMHASQLRKSGDPYFTHPVEVAMLLAEQKLDDATIVTALLHDTIEDTLSTYADLAHHFGEEIAQLVDGVTKLTNLELSSVENEQAENFRKLLMAMSKDLRVLLVKLADRLHNMRTISHLSPEKQQRKARETMDIYAPLAGRMGMQWMRDELEDLGFRVLNPEGRKSIIRRFVTLRRESGDVIAKITEDIRTVLGAGGRRGRGGRAGEEALLDLAQDGGEEGGLQPALRHLRLPHHHPLGRRLLHRRSAPCTSAGRRCRGGSRTISASRSRTATARSTPRSRGATASGSRCRSARAEMHAVAETGVAAHWSYRDGERFENPFAVDPFKWVRSITERLGGEEDEDFLEHVKLEMFQDQVFCFTPKGEVVKLPRGATPIDFAYAIHTRIGDSCVGAKVDGQRVPLWTKLRNGQSVTIIRAEGQRPQPSWEDMVVTGRAKAAIRRSLRGEQRATQVRLGREIARVALERVGKKATDKAMEAAARRLGLEEAEDVLARLGAAEMTGKELVATLYPELLRDAALPRAGGRHRAGGDRPRLGPGGAAGALLQSDPRRADRRHRRARQGGDHPRHRLRRARRLRGGAATAGSTCAGPTARRAPTTLARVEVTLANDAGVLGRICTLIGEQRANITDIVFTDRKPDFFRMVIDMEVQGHGTPHPRPDRDRRRFRTWRTVRRFRQAPAAAKEPGRG